jgi:hypothetical protein
MPVKSYTVKEGTLTFGASGTSMDATAQVTSCEVDWEEEVEDAVPTLSGEELEGEATYTATLSGTFVQDLTETGLIDWTWDNKGQIVPFTYVPSSAAGRSITGTVRVRPLKVGGEVKTKPTADFEWTCIGEPVLGADLT